MTDDEQTVPARITFHRRPSGDGPTYRVCVEALSRAPGIEERTFHLSDIDEPQHAWEIDSFVTTYTDWRNSVLPESFDVDLPLTCFAVEPIQDGPVRRHRYISVLSALDPYLRSQDFKHG